MSNLSMNTISQLSLPIILLGGLTRRWFLNRFTNIIIRFIVISSSLAGIFLLYVSEGRKENFIYASVTILAFVFGMILDVVAEKAAILNVKARRNGKK